MSGGQHSRERGGYVTAWCGDLNADLPTIIFLTPFPQTEPEPDEVEQSGRPSLAVLRAVRDALRRF
ncbi:hypothetical protein [Saccharopolyspora gloriosae]|uniref:hypothetical protein n=1 Tax=Saccharopolyspora gloriosae TaxID=455344 RepID=UPI001FB85A42|nr:hypothetical protein [Saccharopolyspora gloriosae]